MVQGRSLMDFVDTPVLVGDPDGRAVYANPAFERDFQISKDTLTGVPLASLFEGGAREAMLAAVAGVCGGASRERFRMREGPKGFQALASPVEVDEGRVGVVILLFEEPPAQEKATPDPRSGIQAPLDELTECLMGFAADSGEELSLEKARIMLAEALRLVDRVRKGVDAQPA